MSSYDCANFLISDWYLDKQQFFSHKVGFIAVIKTLQLFFVERFERLQLKHVVAALPSGAVNVSILTSVVNAGLLISFLFQVFSLEVAQAIKKVILIQHNFQVIVLVQARITTSAWTRLEVSIASVMSKSFGPKFLYESCFSGYESDPMAWDEYPPCLNVNECKKNNGRGSCDHSCIGTEISNLLFQA